MIGPKHQWMRDENGEIDIFAYNVGHHNGPVCEACNESFCHHCNPGCYEEVCDEVLVVFERPTTIGEICGGGDV